MIGGPVTARAHRSLPDGSKKVSGSEDTMGQARDLLDKVTAAMLAKDREALGRCYAPDAIAVTPDSGEVKGREAIVEWFDQFMTAFPDLQFDPIAEHEDGDSAIDEGYVIATNTGPITMPTGEIPPTGKRVRLRECDVAVVSDGLVKEHHFYYDQAEFMEQLGLTPA